MKHTILFFVAFSLSFVYAIHAEEIRTWTSGKYKTEAEFVKLSADGKTVTLKKKDGKETNAPLEKLSKEDQDYVKSVQRKVAVGTVNNEKETNFEDSKFKVTKENFVRYEDDGTVVIRTKNGGQTKNHIRQLTQDDMNCILELEIKSIASEQFFSPERIKEQIDAHFVSKPIMVTAKKMEDDEQTKKEIEESKNRIAELKKQKQKFDEEASALSSRGKIDLLIKKQNQSMEIFKKIQDEEKRINALESETIDIVRNLTTYEKNSVVLALLKLQKIIDQKYGKETFNDVMDRISFEKSHFGKIIDAYITMKEIQTALLRADGRKLSSQIYVDNLREDITRKMITEGKATHKDLGDFASGALTKLDAASEEREKRNKSIAAVMPYCNKFSAFKHKEEEARRLKKLEEETRKNEYEQKSKDLFK